ncbi:hypothetical protein CC2G_007655 [Coprinopsis cinerea AmutBmut pab1-1]|nr:hypothetical protein CC2G_007655 [Coprinopsis cinerea AmutBmut pab1-1]
MAPTSSTEEIKVLVTGFGPFRDVTTNPSWEIARNLPTELTSPNGTPIKLIVSGPIPVVYHKVFAQSPELIEKHNPHLVVHIGLDAGIDYIAVEQSALKEGYHEIPDYDRKVFTRSDNKTAFAKHPSSLKSSLDLESAVSACQSACASVTIPVKDADNANGKQAKRRLEVKLSDDVGTYLCGFIYYCSMLEMQKRKEKRDVVFVHVPPLESEAEISAGAQIVRELIGALVDTSVTKA